MQSLSLFNLSGYLHLQNDYPTLFCVTSRRSIVHVKHHQSDEDIINSITVKASKQNRHPSRQPTGHIGHQPPSHRHRFWYQTEHNTGVFNKFYYYQPVALCRCWVDGENLIGLMVALLLKNHFVAPLHCFVSPGVNIGKMNRAMSKFILYHSVLS